MFERHSYESEETEGDQQPTNRRNLGILECVREARQINPGRVARVSVYRAPYLRARRGSNLQAFNTDKVVADGDRGKERNCRYEYGEPTAATGGKSGPAAALPLADHEHRQSRNGEQRPG